MTPDAHLSTPDVAPPSAGLEVVDTPERAAAMLKPIRRELLDRLRSPASAAGLARQLSVPRQRLNHHLRELERAGLVSLVEERRRGNCTERLYQATAEHYLIAPQALGELAPPDPQPSSERRSWAHLVALAGKMLRELTVLRRKADQSGKHLATFGVQARVRVASPKKLALLRERLAESVTAAIAEVHDEAAEEGRSYELLLGVYPTLQSTLQSTAPSGREEGGPTDD